MRHSSVVFGAQIRSMQTRAVLGLFKSMSHSQQFIALPSAVSRGATNTLSPRSKD